MPNKFCLWISIVIIWNKTLATELAALKSATNHTQVEFILRMQGWFSIKKPIKMTYIRIINLWKGLNSWFKKFTME
jgi:hypothetical protein